MEEKSEIGVEKGCFGMRKGDTKYEREKASEHIPDTLENKETKKFLENAPTKGLFVPLGKEVKVMQCWRCKNYGHRAGFKALYFF